MHRRCPICELSYFPESGFYLGGMIINYVITVWVIVAVYLLSLLFPDLVPWSINAKIFLWMIFAVACSLLLWRHCQSLWLGLNYWVEPQQPDSPQRGGL
jgi:hypothetical protein